MNWFIDRLKEFSSNEALVYQNKSWNYSDFMCELDLCSLIISKSNISAGQIVCVVGEFSPKYIAFILGLLLNKNIYIPISLSSVIEIDVALRLSGSHWIVEIKNDDIKILTKFNEVKSNIVNKILLEKKAGLILFSSGTSGKPKGMAYDFPMIIEKFRKKRQPIRALPFLMVDHFGGINTILSIMASGGVIITSADRSAGGVARTIEAHKVELLPTTPSFLNLFISTGQHKKFDLSSLKKITYGTEVMTQVALDRINKIFPYVELQQTYGLSEVGVLGSKSKGDGTTWVSVGGAGFETKVVDGILWVKSTCGMLGYLYETDGLGIDSHGWFNTQDRVEVDGDYIKILGRDSDLINVGGQKVYPAEVEEELMILPNIRDVAVYGEQHPLLGQIVVAKLLLHAPESLNDLKIRIRSHCKSRLAGYKIPSKIIITEEELYSVRQKKIRR